jgi:hypothetical protein
MPLPAPVIAATRLRGGNAASPRRGQPGRAGTIATARDCGCTGMIVVWLDSSRRGAVHGIRVEKGRPSPRDWSSAGSGTWKAGR